MDIRSLSGIGFQIGKLAAEIISVYLYSPGVYVAIPRYSFQFPSNIQSFSGFDVTFENIMTIIIEMEEQATVMKNSKEIFESCCRSFGNSRPLHDDNQTDYAAWTLPSWYPPVNKKQRKSKTPEDIVAPSSSSSTSGKTTVDYVCSLVDEFGWAG